MAAIPNAARFDNPFAFIPEILFAIGLSRFRNVWTPNAEYTDRYSTGYKVNHIMDCSAGIMELPVELAILIWGKTAGRSV